MTEKSEKRSAIEEAIESARAIYNFSEKFTGGTRGQRPDTDEFRRYWSKLFIETKTLDKEYLGAGRIRFLRNDLFFYWESFVTKQNLGDGYTSEMERQDIFCVYEAAGKLADSLELCLRFGKGDKK
ncbi:MAG: hypothetical protein WC548_02105 [Candidatus Pacearchaeota archaeon]